MPKPAKKAGGLVLIVTPTTIEWEAMRGKMSHTKRADEDSPAVRGTIGSFDVLCAMPGKGPGATTAVAMQLIERHGPRYVLLVGVAGGLGGVRRGDLVVPTAVHDLDYGKVEDGEFRRRKEYDWTPDYKLLQYAQLLGESATSKWRNRIRAPRPDKKTSVASDAHFGYVGSSGKVVDDSDYSVIQDALKTATELLAVEMEATGAGAAVRVAQSGAHVGLLMVRGISDLVSASSAGKGAGTNQRRKWKAYAADVAATFAASLLKELSPKGQKELPAAGSETEETDASETADESIAILAATVGEVLRKMGAGSAASLSEEPIRRTFDAPPAVAKVVRRAETIAAFSREIQSRTWTSIVGPRGSGKTHLAILLSQGYRSAKWLRPEDVRKVEIFDNRLREIGSSTDGTPAESACAAIGRGGMLILDDVPTDSPEVVTALAAFGVVAEAHEVHVVSLSAGSLPATIRRALGDEGYLATAVPDFSDQEAEELFRMYGAPNEVHGHVKFLNASAHGNPTLLTAVAEYLRGRAWALGGDEVVRILSRAHLAEIEPETLQRLLTDVKDADTRGLFHRLRVARQTLSFATIAALAAIEPKIDRVRERLFDLEGLWVRRSAPDVFEVVHLAEALPARALDPDTERNCHVVVARAIVGKREITPAEAASAVSHFTAGGDVNGAGAALAHALSSIVADKAWHETLLPSIWATEPLPKAMNRSLRLSIRLEQVRIARATRSGIAFLSKDLKELIGEATFEDAGLLAAITFGFALKRRVAGELWDLAMTALERLAPMIPSDGQLSIRDHDLPAKTWMVAFHLAGRSANSVEQLARWTRTVDSLHAGLRAHLVASSEFNAVSLVDEWWLRAVDEKADREELELLLERLEIVERWTSDHPDSELLGAAAARARIIVVGEYVEDLSRAVVIGEQAITSYQSGAAQFLLREALGTQYSVAGQFETAERWLMSSLDHAASTTGSRHVTALLRAAQAAGRRDPKRAVDLLEEALLVARRGPAEDLVPHQLAQVLGDLGIAASQAGDLRRAFEVWGEAANLILSSDLRRPIWRGISAILHVALAYPALQLRMGRAPIVPATGEEMDRPLVGLFLRDLAREGAGYKPEFRTQIEMSLTYIASAIGDREATRMWAMRAYEEANSQKDAERSSLIAVELLPFALLDDDVGGALTLIGERILTMREAALTEAAESGAGVFLHFLILVTFRVCRLALDDEEKARVLFATLREWALANLNGVTRDAFATVCDAALQPDGRAILEALYQRDDLPPSILLIARLVHSLDHGGSTAVRAADHLTIALGVSHRAFMWGMAYSWIVLGFFETYWMRELLSNGFRFANPSEVRRALVGASSLPVGERLQAMLLAIADGVGVRLQEDFRHTLLSRRAEIA